MNQRRNTLAVSLLIASLLPITVNAHGRWVVPSHTMLTGNKPHTITVDMSISNELFKPDYGFIPLIPHEGQQKGPPPAQLNLIGPNDTKVSNIPFEYFVRKSVGAIELTQDGTHLISLQQAPVTFRLYTNDKGKRARAWGLDSALPDNSKHVTRYSMQSNLLSFVSRNKLTSAPLIKKGLEIANGSHPNDLFAGETARFQLLFNGNPVRKGHSLTVVRGETRYRNDRQVFEIETDNQGWFEFTWPNSGLYLVETELDVNDEQDALTNKYALFVTLEVAPE